MMAFPGGSDAAASNEFGDVSIAQDFLWTDLSSSTTMSDCADPGAVPQDLTLWKVLSHALDEEENHLSLLLVNKEWNKVVTVLKLPTVRRLAHMNRKFKKEGTQFNPNCLEALANFFAQIVNADSKLFRKPSRTEEMEQEDQLFALPSLQPQFHIAVKRFIHSAQAQGLMSSLTAVAKEAAFCPSTVACTNMWVLFNLENEPESATSFFLFVVCAVLGSAAARGQRVLQGANGRLALFGIRVRAKAGGFVQGRKNGLELGAAVCLFFGPACRRRLRGGAPGRRRPRGCRRRQIAPFVRAWRVGRAVVVHWCCCCRNWAVAAQVVHAPCSVSP